MSAQTVICSCHFIVNLIFGIFSNGAWCVSEKSKTFQPKPTRGRMRIHCLENVDKGLQFLRDQHVHLENLGSHDVVDGNPRLTLGLIWTIILRFQV